MFYTLILHEMFFVFHMEDIRGDSILFGYIAGLKDQFFVDKIMNNTYLKGCS